MAEPTKPEKNSDLNSANSSFLINEATNDLENRATIPFAFLKGERDLCAGRSVDGLAGLTNYRFYHKGHLGDHLINVPLGLISHIETSGGALFIFCKNGRSYSLAFFLKEIAQWEAQIKSKLNQLEAEACFAFSHFLDSSHEKDFHHVTENSPSNGETAPSTKPENGDGEDSTCKVKDEIGTYHNGDSGKSENDFKNSLVTKEARRMKFNLENVWRISTLNEHYGLCPSYPRQIITPIQVSDENLIEVAKYRRKERIPAVVWRHQENGRVIARCSQPSQGLWGYTSQEDQQLLAAIHETCLDGTEKEIPSLLIVDARSAMAAFGNRFNVGGHEDVQCYSNCEIEFMNIANIHRVRDSLNAVSLLCATPDRLEWLVCLEGTCWLSYISSIIKAALVIVKAVHDDWRPVLVHCSDGWDRTSQLTSLSQLLLDPYYRTMEGFQILVEREWLEFGHKFADRCGHWNSEAAEYERSPVFLQWLDCVFQLQQQFPFDFEFNEQYLIRLATHTYSCLFGDFFCNTDEQRRTLKLQEKTFSVWPALKGVKEFRNEFYCEKKEVLRPSCQIRNLKFWSNMYLQKEAIHQNTFKMLQFESKKTSQDPSKQRTSSPKEDIDPTKKDNPLETSDIPEIPDLKLGDSESRKDPPMVPLSDNGSVSEVQDPKVVDSEPKDPEAIPLSSNESVSEVPGIESPKDEDSDAEKDSNPAVQVIKLSDSGSVSEVPDEEDPGQSSSGPLDLLSLVLPNMYSMYNSLCSLVPSLPFYGGTEEAESPKKESSCIWVFESTKQEPEESTRVLDFDGLFLQEDFVSTMARKFGEKNQVCSCKQHCQPDLSKSDS